MGTAAAALRIIILRHAEKTGNPADRDLSEQGKRRAAALALALPESFGRIDHIVAARSSEHSDRPLRTVEPLAKALCLEVDERWKTNAFAQLAEALTSQPQCADRQVLICWRHKSLQQLALCLGAERAQPWPETEYDRTWMISLAPSGTLLQQWHQQLDGETLAFLPDPQPR